MNRRGTLRTLAAALLLAAGCSPPAGETEERAAWDIDPATLRPAEGVVTHQGKPLAGAVVAFYPASMVASVADVDNEGKYKLKTLGNDGVVPGAYKVTISYLRGPSGKPSGLGARSSLMPSKDTREAVEALPPEYSNVEKTKLTAQVPADGGKFDFDIPVPLLDAPAPKAADAPGPKDAEPSAEPPAEKKDASPAAEKP